MKLNSIQLKHTTIFPELSIHFQHHKHTVTVILGEQASGKTSIVKTIYQALSWFPARFKDLRTAGIVMPDQDILHNAKFSKIDISIEIPSEIGSLPETSTTHPQMLNQCRWQLYKILQHGGIGYSKVECSQLEQCVTLYHKALQQDPLQGLPMIAYYPSERFVHELNLLNKNNPSVLQHHSAFELSPIPFTTFTRFFEWLREISDIENAQSTQLLQQLLADPRSEHDFSQVLEQNLIKIKSQQHSSCLYILKKALSNIFPEITDLYLEYHPQLQLMLCYKNQTLNYLQLSSSLKTWVALIGDIVRRLCILNPMSINPCQEGHGILLIDHIDAHLDPTLCSVILDRLQATFPELQIIVTAQQQSILDNSAYFQYFKLAHQCLHEIKRQHTWQQHQQIYAQIMQQPQPPQEKLTQQDEQSKAQVIFKQIQKLNQNEQAELNRLLQADDDSSKEISSY